MPGVVVLPRERPPAPSMLGVVVPRRPEAGAWRPPKASSYETVRGRVSASFFLLLFPADGADLLVPRLGRDWWIRPGRWHPGVGSVTVPASLPDRRVTVSLPSKFLASCRVGGGGVCAGMRGSPLVPDSSRDAAAGARREAVPTEPLEGFGVCGTHRARMVPRSRAPEASQWGCRGLNPVWSPHPTPQTPALPSSVSVASLVHQGVVIRMTT